MENEEKNKQELVRSDYHTTLGTSFPDSTAVNTSGQPDKPHTPHHP